MLYREIIVVCSEIHTLTQCVCVCVCVCVSEREREREQNAEFESVKPGGTYV